MNGDTRNTKVVVILILAMTVGARVLLWLEPDPGRQRRGAVSPLLAAGATTVDDVVVEYGRQGDTSPAGTDIVILPDGTCEGHPDGTSWRVVVLGVRGGERLAAPQKQTLLTVLESLAHQSGARAVRVRLDQQSDASSHPELPPAAHELRELLALKGHID